MTSDHFDLQGLLLILRRRWLLILGLTLLVGGAALAYSELKTPEYTATASIVFEDPQVSQEASGLQPTNTSQYAPQITATNIQLLAKQSGVAAATARSVGHGLTPRQVGNALSVSEEGQTNIADIAATDIDPHVATAMANAFAQAFIGRQTALQRASVGRALSLVQKQLSSLSPQERVGTNGQALTDRAESLKVLASLQDGGARVVSLASVPTAPSSPRPLRNVVLGVVLGLLLGVSAAFLLHRLDQKIRSVGDLEAAYQLPLLSAVPQNDFYAHRPEPTAATRRGESEVFRLLRAYLRYFNVDRELRTIMVASAAPGDGKSTVSRNLAQAAQETGSKTLLIEADLRRPDVARVLALEPGLGLSDVLIGTATADAAIRQVPVAERGQDNGSDNVLLDVLVAGHLPPNPAELLESRAMTNLISWAADHYDLVVIDTPPLGVVSDAIPLLKRVDGVVIVSHLGKHTRDAAAALRKRLMGLNAPLLGVVANGVDKKATSEYGYGYYLPETEPSERAGADLEGSLN